MSYLKNLKWEMIICSLLSILMGILMWKYPGKIMTGVCVILAIILFVMGIRNIIEYKRSNVIKDFYRYELVVGIVLIAAGILVLACMKLILSIITYVIAIIIIISGLMKGQPLGAITRICHNMYSFGNFSFNDANEFQ